MNLKKTLVNKNKINILKFLCIVKIITDKIFYCVSKLFLRLPTNQNCNSVPKE